MIPLMGFCVLSLFGGYAIYFPELFPTRAAPEPHFAITSVVSPPHWDHFLSVCLSATYLPGTMSRSAMQASPCALLFLIGLAALPFAPETRGQPLPE